MVFVVIPVLMVNKVERRYQITVKTVKNIFAKNALKDITLRSMCSDQYCYFFCSRRKQTLSFSR